MAVGRWIKSQLSRVTWAGIGMILWSFIPDTLSRWGFWHDAIPTLKKILALSLTAGGRLGLLLVGISLIALEQLGLLGGGYNLKTLQGRTLKLRDDIKKYLK